MSTIAYSRRKGVEPAVRDIGKRLREERERLGMSQEVFGEIGGVRRATQYLYEQGDRIPSMEYLARVVAAGADLGYLVLGKRGRSSDSRWSIDKNVLASVYSLVDEFARDPKGRLLDLEHRIVLLGSLCNAVTDSAPEDVDWDALRAGLKVSRGGS
jgi:transcriptional regulator with XRE-family HTH domain